MPSIPRHNTPLPNEQSRNPRSITPSRSDTADRIRLRGPDAFLDHDPNYEVSQLSPQIPHLVFDSSHLLRPRSLDSQSHSLSRRQNVLPGLPATYAGVNSGPAAGTIVGIVLGVVLGYLLIFWLIVTIIGSRNQTANYIEGDDTEIVVRRDHHSSRRSKRSHRSRRAKTEVSETSERPPPPEPRVRREPSRQRTERIIVQETRREQSRPPPPMSPRSDHQGSIDIDINIDRRSRAQSERRVEGDNVVEVIEEESATASESVSTPDPQPKRKSRTSGVRHVDPNQYAGGNYPRYDISPARSRSRR